jgi:hypothetical protein
MIKTLPSVTRIVELLKSGDTAEQIEGIVWAGMILRTDIRMINQAPSGERLEIGALPRRVYERIFSDSPDVSREAAFVMMACSKSFGEPFAYRARFSELNARERALFVSSLPKLLFGCNLAHVIHTEAKILRPLEDGAEVEVNVVITRRLPFDVDGAPVLLQERPLKRGNEVRIFVQSEKTISEDQVREISDQERIQGVVGKGSVVHLLKPAPTKGDLIKVVIVFDAYIEAMEFAFS